MEDQEIMDQFLEHRQQNYVIDNINAVAGCGGIGAADVGSGEILGVKYDEQLQNEEHDVGDDDEWKYVKEVQQSEKQQSVKDLADCGSNELAENEEVKYKYEKGNGAEGMGGVTNIESVIKKYGNTNSNGHEIHVAEDKAMQDVTISLPTSVDDEPHQFQDDVNSGEYTREQPEIGEDEEPSSLTTNTTNGTSSLSETVPQLLLSEQENASDVVATEGSISLDIGDRQCLDNTNTEQMQSQLNPDAKEFVPNFGSNPTSPISPQPEELKTLNNADIEQNQFFGQAPTAVPRHVMADDDFLAQSPRKGRSDNMDTISLPAEQEFDEEADRRPHELEQDEAAHHPTDISVKSTSNDIVVEDDLLKCDVDFHKPDATDHGPETSVDLDVDICKHQSTEFVEIENDVMKQSIYVANDDELIEDVLNSVQPIPAEIDNVKNSFADELFSTDTVGDKELLQVEEKEHISNSPSTDEMQMHLQSTLNSSNNDFSSVPTDISNAVAMQESFYMEQMETTDSIDRMPESLGEIPLLDTFNSVMESDNKFDVCSKEEISHAEELKEDESGLQAFTNEQRTNIPNLDTEEKHLLEKTKETIICPEQCDLEQQMSDMLLNTDDHLSQVEEVAVSTTVTVVEDKQVDLNTQDVADEVCEQDPMIENLGNQIENKPKDLNTQDVLNEICEEDPIMENIGKQNGQNSMKGETETPKLHHEEETEMITAEQPLIETELKSEIFSSNREQEMEWANSIIKDDVPSANISEILLPTVAPAENTTPCILESLSTNEMLVPETNETENVETAQNLLFEQEKDQQELTVNLMENNGEELSTKEHDNEKSSDVAPAVDMIAAVSEAAKKTKNVLPLTAKKNDEVKKTAIKTTANEPKPKTSSNVTSTLKKTTVTEMVKKPIGGATKPRLPPNKSTTAEKKPVKLTPAPSLARKAMGTTTTVTKVAAKTTSTSTITRASSATAGPKAVPARPIAAARTISSATSARKTAAPSSITATKSRPVSASGVASVPAKPTSLGVSGANNSSKTKVSSPRATLTSHLRKSAPTSTNAKSPVKSTITNVTKTVSSTLGNRGKPASSAMQGVGSSTVTKTFTARPVPKFNSSTSTTTASNRRLTVGATTTSTTTTQTISKSSSSILRKSSPTKPVACKTSTKSPNSVAGAKIKTTEHKYNGDDKDGDLIASTANSSDQQNSLPQNDGPVMPNVNDPPTQGQNGGTENMQVDVISA